MACIEPIHMYGQLSMLPHSKRRSLKTQHCRVSVRVAADKPVEELHSIPTGEGSLQLIFIIRSLVSKLISGYLEG